MADNNEIKGVKAFDDFHDVSNVAKSSAAIDGKAVLEQAKELGREGARNAANAMSTGAVGVVGSVRAGIGHMRDFVANVAGKAKAGFMAFGGKVGSFLAVGPAAGAVIGSLALTATLAVPAAMAVDALVPGASDAARYAGLDDDCSEEVDSKRKIYGEGEIQIPETYQGIPVGTVAEYEGHVTAIDAQLHITEGSSMHRIYDLWIQKGKKHDSTGVFDKIDDYYVAAIAPDGFAHDGVKATDGDWVTFYFDNGEGIDIIVGDVKSPGDPNYCIWGHGSNPNSLAASTYIKVLEFWGFHNGGTNAYECLAAAEGWDTAPTRVTSATNHGTADIVVNMSGGWGFDVTKGAQDNAKRTTIKRAMDDCAETRDNGVYDNSGIAEAALSYAYTLKSDGGSPSTAGPSYPGTALYKKIFGNILPGDVSPKSCDRTVCIAVRWSGSDDDIPAGNADGIQAYLASSSRWKYVGTSSVGDTSIMEPGDIIWRTSHNHIAVYVGAENVEKWEFKGDQILDICPTPKSGYCCVAGSYHREGGDGWNGTGCAPGVSNEPAGDSYEVYRCIDPANSDKYTGAAEG